MSAPGELGPNELQCPHCNGYGSSLKDPVGVDRCTMCGGSGRLKKQMKLCRVTFTTLCEPNVTPAMLADSVVNALRGASISYRELAATEVKAEVKRLPY